MKKAFFIAKATVAELMREKFFLIALFLGLVMIGFSLVLGQLSAVEYAKIMGDFGFTTVEITVTGLSIFLGSFLISKEIDRQTCLLILARPVSRLEFILGKLLGVMVLITFTVFFLMILILVLLQEWNHLGNFFIISFSIWIKSIVILAFVIFMSLVVRPVLATFAGIAIYMLGHWIPDIQFFATKSKDEGFILLSRVVDWIVPNFYIFNWKNYVFLSQGVTGKTILWTLAHGSLWFLFFAILLNWNFRRKDIV